MDIRKVKTKDALNVAGIYNHYIQNTHHTFETEPLTEGEMLSRIEKVTKAFPFLVAEADGEILGYAYATQFKLRNAYEHSAEVSIYVKNAAKQRGVGSSLYKTLFEELYETHIHAIVAGISLPNDASVKFHEKLGFKKVAHFQEIGYKLGRWIDVGYWEKLTF
ncbi:MAG: N-acetyltransferase [Acidobacteria bacterium]|nr:N-acetyltransferase [Acidobacteriota bacterium]